MTQDGDGRGPLFFIGTALFVCVVLAGVFLFVLRDHYLVHYHAWKLITDDGAEASEKWLYDRPLLALPPLMAFLQTPESDACDRSGRFLLRLIEDNDDPTDPGDAHLTMLIAAMLHEQYDSFSLAGQITAVDLSFAILRNQLGRWSPNVPTALETAGGVAVRGLSAAQETLREHALSKADALWQWNGADNVVWSLVQDWKRQCYAVAVKSLESESIPIKKAAVTAIVDAPFQEGNAALFRLVEGDEPTLRRTALLQLARVASDGREICAVDSLTSRQKLTLKRYLSDDDEAIRDAARRILRRSGVSPSQIRMAQLMKHPDPAERAKVVAMAFNVPDVADPVSWVLEMGNDPAPEVRLAVARAAAMSNAMELRSKLRQMAKSDPDIEVREMCRQLLAEKVAVSKDGETQ